MALAEVTKDLLLFVLLALNCERGMKEPNVDSITELNVSLAEWGSLAFQAHLMMISYCG